jgi:uncharacterized membrane protein YozB (DUF420 family)
MEILRDQPGFLGTGASLTADLTLLGYVLLLVPAMLAGWAFARRRRYDPQHKTVMTVIMLSNWVLIAFFMAVSYRTGVAPSLPEGLPRLAIALPTLHLVTGLAAQLLATYLVLRMWFERELPGWLKVKQIRRWMRLTLALWLLTALLGVVTYFVWYVAPPPASADTAAPAATAEAEAAPAKTPEVGGKDPGK